MLYCNIFYSTTKFNKPINLLSYAINHLNSMDFNALVYSLSYIDKRDIYG